LAEGAFADVYKASYRGTNVAVKWFRDHSPDLPTKSDADLNDLFLRELHILSELRHPNIVLVLGAVCDGTNRGYLMERCKSDLFTFNRKMTDAKLSQRLRIAGRLARAVLYMHHAGYIHRDLKSLNILVDQSDQPKIIDFGFCAKVQGTN
jgi:serine/threonine protein kinase